jgi:hypothetical protein
MGCGCKNKGNQTESAQAARSKGVVAGQEPVKAHTSESVKDAIKKTIEKYYSQGKTRG